MTTRAQAAAPCVSSTGATVRPAGARPSPSPSPSPPQNQSRVGALWRLSHGAELVVRELSGLTLPESWANFPHGTHAWTSVAALCAAVSSPAADSGVVDDDDDERRR